MCQMVGQSPSVRRQEMLCTLEWAPGTHNVLQVVRSHQEDVLFHQPERCTLNDHILLE